MPTREHDRPELAVLPARRCCIAHAHDELVREPTWGPAAWPASLRTILRMMLSSRYAMWLGWGTVAVFYNDAYREQTLGQRHPWALGKPTREVWAEIWDWLEPSTTKVIMKWARDEFERALPLFLERSGYSEETFHTFLQPRSG